MIQTGSNLGKCFLELKTAYFQRTKRQIRIYVNLYKQLEDF